MRPRQGPGAAQTAEPPFMLSAAIAKAPLPLSSSERMKTALGWVVGLGLLIAVMSAIVIGNRQQQKMEQQQQHSDAGSNLSSNSPSPAKRKGSKKRGNDDHQNSGKYLDELTNTADYVSYRLACHKEDYLEQHSPPIHPPLSFLPQNPTPQHLGLGDSAASTAAATAAAFKFPAPVPGPGNGPGTSTGTGTLQRPGHGHGHGHGHSNLHGSTSMPAYTFPKEHLYLLLPASGLEILDPGEVVYIENRMNGVVTKGVILECGSVLPDVYIWGYTQPGTPTIRAVAYNFGKGPKLQKLAKTLGDLSIIRNSASISIAKLPLAAEGLYTCQALYDTPQGAKLIYYYIHLRVLVPVTRPYIVLSDSSPKENHQMWMRCGLENGTGPVTYMWEHTSPLYNTTGIMAQGTNSLVNITKVNRNFTGWYRCLARNQVNQASSDRTWLDIIFGPDVPNIEITPYSVTERGYSALEKETVTLMCQASSNPASEYVWFYNNSQVYMGPTYTITRILRMHTGHYACLAQNTYLNTRSRKSITLTVYYAPEGGPSCTIRPTNNYTALSLTCLWEGGLPHASLHWSSSIPGVVRKSPRNATLVQTGPGTGNNTVFMCYASHVALNASRSCLTRTWHPPGEPQCYAYATRNNEYLMFSCSWEGGNPRALLWWSSNTGETHGKSEENSNILILRSSYTYSGKSFVCQAQHPLFAERKQCTIKLVPVEGPSVVLRDSSPVAEGSSLLMDCALKNGSEPITYIWEQEDRGGAVSILAEGNSSRLHVSYVTRNHTGWYRCLASNEVNQVLSERFWLDVFFGPDPPQIDIRPHSVTDKGFFALEKATVWLMCQASSNPLSEYVWFYNNSLVDTGPILTIAYISRRQAGLYTCLSENKYINTSSESTATLSVYYPPDDYPRCTIYPTNNYTDLSLWCSWGGGLPHASLHWTPFPTGVIMSQGYANATLVHRGPGTVNNTVFMCHGSHAALNVSRSCSARTWYPSGEPQCYANATLDSESLLLSCSWEGGLPSALLWWTSDSGDTLKEEESTNNLMLPSNITHHIRSFTCHAQHPLLAERRECVLQLEPPDGSPSCTILPTNNYTDLTLWCSWEGGYPHASLHWSPFPAEEDGKGYSNAIHIQRGPETANNSVFVCHGSHVTLETSKSCTTRAWSPPGELLCSANASLTHEHLVLSCSWGGGFPRALLWWTSDSGDEEDTAAVGEYEESSNTLLLSASAGYGGRAFVCQAQHPLSAERKKCAAVPVARPSLVFSDSSPAEGSSVWLRCDLGKGTEPIRYLWEQEHSNGTTSVLARSYSNLVNVTLVTRHHAGWHKCTASNEVNREQSQRVALNVIYGPDVPGIGVSPRSVAERGYSALERQTVSLQCQASSNPPSRYVWFYNNSQVHMGQTLTIAKIPRSRTGRYTCLAQNTRLDTRSKNSVTLTVYYPPDGAPSCDILPINNYTDLALLCSWEGGYPQAVLRWTPPLLVGVGGEGSGNVSYIQTGRRTANNSVFVCQGSHVALNASRSCKTKTWHPPAEPQCYAYATRNNEYLMLSCTWEGGFPRALLWWSSGSGVTHGKSEENANILVLRSSATYSGKSFLCHAQHPLIAERKTCVLKLEAPVLQTQRSYVSVYEGSDVQLTCILTANYPATEITWYNNLKQHVIESPAKYVLQQAAAWSNLTVKETDNVRDSGQYWCSATNAVGGTEIPILLLVKRYPMPPNVTINKLVYTSTQRTEIDMEWFTKTEGDTTGFIIERRGLAQPGGKRDVDTSESLWLKVAVNLDPSTVSYKMSGFDPLGTYAVRIMAVNHRTIGHPSEEKTPTNPPFNDYPAVIGAAIGGMIVAGSLMFILFIYILRNRNNNPRLHELIFGNRNSISRESISTPEDEYVGGVQDVDTEPSQGPEMEAASGASQQGPVTVS
ncbi:hemicentin-1 [Engraulis encrasicolus]|uniref:hemicentin-1 n=1 Tax=Engraulis encrasicolus TaxID=184585 RepID=UPI002FD74D92